MNPRRPRKRVKLTLRIFVSRAIVGGRATTARTLVLEVRAFDDPTSAMQASVKALRQPQGPTRAISVATARELLTDQRVHLLRVIRKERPASVAELARLCWTDGGSGEG